MYKKFNGSRLEKNIKELKVESLTQHICLQTCKHISFSFFVDS